MLESTGCCSQQPRHHFRVLLLLLSITFMARPMQSVAANLGIQDQSVTCPNCRDPLTIHSRRLRTSSDDGNWRGDFVSKPASTDEPNWRAFMSKPASVDEANWRDAMNKAAPSMGAVVEIGLLGEDGSMSEAFFVTWDECSQGGMELLLPKVESTMADYSNASRFVIPQPENKVEDVLPCQESMQDLLPARQEEPCLVTVPSHYVRQYKWPLSQLKARVQNVPHAPLLKSRRSRAWVHVDASTIFFLSGGPMYPKGAESYLDHLMQLVPELGVGTTIRVALDLECGTGSLSQVLGLRGVTTLCLAAYDSLEDGVQLVMERGFPGLLAHSFSGSRIMRLPYPSQAFDLLHCAACNMSWLSNDGTLFFEADRILRSGGFFVWIMDVANQGFSWSDMAIQADKLCWKLVIRNHQLAVWRKPANMTSAICSNDTHVPLCNLLPAPESESKWKGVMKPCLENTKEDNTFPVDANWTSRLLNPPKRLKTIPAGGLQRAKEEVFRSDFNYWVYLTDFYVRSFGSSRVADIRNVLDVNAGYGSFAAALALRTPPVPWWVLNVVPVDQPDRLPVIFDRGLLGLYHDWCEPLDSYARTFDLVHASRFFGIQHRCSAQAILLEIDRLLRPGGFALFRDHKEVLLRLQEIARVLHWKAHIDDTESGTWGTDKLLHCQKTRWTNGSKPKY